MDFIRYGTIAVVLFVVGFSFGTYHEQQRNEKDNNAFAARMVTHYSSLLAQYEKITGFVWKGDTLYDPYGKPYKVLGWRDTFESEQKGKE